MDVIQRELTAGLAGRLINDLLNNDRRLLYYYAYHVWNRCPSSMSNTSSSRVTINEGQLRDIITEAIYKALTILN